MEAAAIHSCSLFHFTTAIANAILVKVILFLLKSSSTKEFLEISQNIHIDWNTTQVFRTP
jgi:hypothetical protein